jgi:hypothetical protein
VELEADWLVANAFRRTLILSGTGGSPDRPALSWPGDDPHEPVEAPPHADLLWLVVSQEDHAAA